MERRDFIKFCAATAAAAQSPALAADAQPRFYAKARLLDDRGVPLRAGAIPANRNLIFHYPCASTPCFLLNLGKPARASATLKTADNQSYEWKGGVGGQRSEVAFSAISAHPHSYLTTAIRSISYRSEWSARTKSAPVIACCAAHC